MILKSVTLTGFKSFAKKTTIDVSKNVTGIVGPNGSGKSNIAEAIRFVMGEQSMKSIRSKSLSDLIFKGSEYIPSMSRASVSLEIDNRIKNYNDGVSADLATYLNYDDITLSREIYLDGGSVYKINGAEVRLKDVQSLLALAGIGASAHTIISQGEADKILTSSSKDRREMIEDALGLKIYQIRLKDSERKLKKVAENMHDIELMRRELAPELNHLKVQMDKLNRVEDERDKLCDAYLQFFAQEEVYIKKENEIILSKTNNIVKLEEKRKQLEELRQKEHLLSSPDDNKDSDNKVIEDKISDLGEIRIQKERDLSMLMYESRDLLNKIENVSELVSVSRADLSSLKQNIQKLFSQIEIKLAAESFEGLNALFLLLKEQLFILNSWSKENNNQEIERGLSVVSQKIKENESEIEVIKNNIINLNHELNVKKEEGLKIFKIIYESIYGLEKDISELVREEEGNKRRKEMLSSREEENNFALEEAVRFVGHRVLNYRETKPELNYNYIESKRQIERLKIRIEEMGIIDPTNLKNSYEEIISRDVYLEKELKDLRDAKSNLDIIINDLEKNIKEDFESGINKINFAFANLFHDVFPGGRAGIKLEKLESNTESDDADCEAQTGIVITVSLPSKKVSDLNMLSGGEKTLVSIALLFALTSITPPPFMVLDETDAALDELNARKYGKLLAKLAEKSRLLVITHNRETMNECDLLYGVTVGGDGSSKILSIKFD